MKHLDSGGGWHAIGYTLRKAREVGFLKLWRALRSKNACKTCAVGMGGQLGGMVNEAGHFPEVCKKSLQAMVADMQGEIAPEFWTEFSIPKLQALSPRQLESAGRLVQPVIHERGASHYRPVGWDEAFDLIVEELRRLSPRETFWYFSGRSSNEAGFLLQLFARLYGTNNVNNCSYFCHQASGVGLTSVTGSGTATITLEDLENADLVFVIGGNPPSNHPRLMRSLAHVRCRGGHVIVINPVIELGLVKFRVPSDPWSLLFGSRIASLYIQPDIGGDLALLTGVAKRIVELGAHDESFLRAHCEGWDELALKLSKVGWSEIYAKSGVDPAAVDAIAEYYAAAKNVVFAWTMGITHHAHGVQSVQAIANLALLRGMVGRASAGLLPIRGHSNVQGIGSVGVTPKLKEAVFERLESRFGVRLPTDPGLDTLGCMEQAAAGGLKLGFCLGGNLFGSNPDAAYAAAALSQLDTIVYLNTSLNTGHAHGLARRTIVLPVLARDEEPEPTTQESMFNFVRLSDGGKRRHEGPKSEVEVIATLAARVLDEVARPDGVARPESSKGVGPIDWPSMRRTGKIREAIAQVVPGFEKIGEIDRTKQEFHIGGRTFHAPTFATPTGRARLHVHELPNLLGSAADTTALRLMTVRSEGQFNTVVYEEEDYYRGQDRRDVILLHPHDLERLGLVADERVTVRGAAGSMTGIFARRFDRIKPGNALMYYPEANILVPRHADPQSRTPAFKAVLVTIEPLGERERVAAR